MGDNDDVKPVGQKRYMGGAAIDIDDDSSDDGEYAGLANAKGNQRAFKKNFHKKNDAYAGKAQQCKYHPGRDVRHSTADCFLNPANETRKGENGDGKGAKSRDLSMTVRYGCGNKGHIKLHCPAAKGDSGGKRERDRDATADIVNVSIAMGGLAQGTGSQNDTYSDDYGSAYAFLTTINEDYWCKPCATNKPQGSEKDASAYHRIVIEEMPTWKHASNQERQSYIQDTWRES